MVAPPPTDMSAMAIQAARIRSSSSDTIAHLGKVPTIEDRRAKQSERSDSDDSSDVFSRENSENIKESVIKKDGKKKKGVKVKVVKRQDKDKNNKNDDSDDDSDGSSSDGSGSEATEDSNESYEVTEHSASENQDYDFNEFDADGRSSYEVMGFRSAFPTSRPPIIKGREKESRSALKWVANDCTYSAASLRRARPRKPFAAGFFDRIEVLRRVVLSELAKARSPIEALAAAGIAFDREMLIISAEEVFPREDARKKVCETKPGNFEELAAELEIAARKPRMSKGTQRLVGWKRTQSPSVSKPKKLYFEPFRQEGIGLLHAARCPRAKTASTSRSASRGRGGRQYVGEVEGMEATRSTKNVGAMVAEWNSTQVERSRATCKRESRREAKRRDKEGIKDFTARWSIREGRGTRCGADILDTQEGRYEQANTRFEDYKQALSTATLHSTWGARCGASDKKFKMVSGFRPQTRLPTSGHGATSEEVSRREIRKGNNCFHCPPIRAKSVAVCLHAANGMACTGNSKKIPVGSGGVHRRLPSGVGNEGQVGGRNQGCQEVFRRAWGNSINKEGNRTIREGGVYWSYLGCNKEDGRSSKNKEGRISKSCEKLIETRTIKEHMAPGHRQARISPRSSWAHNAPCAKLVAHSCFKKQRLTHRGDRRGKGRPRVVERDIESQDRTFSRDSSCHWGHCHGCERWWFRLHNKGKHTRRTRRRKQSAKGGKFIKKEQRGAYKQKGNRGDSESTRKSQGRASWKAFDLVLGFNNSLGSGQKTRDPEAVKASMGSHKEGVRFSRTGRNQAYDKTCARKTEWCSRCAFATRRSKDRHRKDNRGSDKEMGPTRGRPMRSHKGTDFSTRVPRVGSTKSALVSKDEGCRTCGQTSGALRNRCCPIGRSNNVGPHGGVGDTTLARRGMVARGRKDASWVSPLGETKDRRFTSVAAKERALARLDGIFGPVKNPLWAERTRAKHEGILFRFLLWQEEHKLVSRRGNSSRTEDAARGLRRYVYSLAKRLSGEALVSNARSLLTSLRGLVNKNKEMVIRAELPILRKKANKRNPPRTRAADPIRLKSLRKLIKLAEQEGLTNLERQALDIFLVAFVTMSRVEEIRTLKVSHVSPKCDTISIRPKMKAGTELRITKFVTNTPGLKAVDILRKYKEEAIEQGRRNLFKGIKGKPPETPEITRMLKKVTDKLKMDERITSHSARKGAAVEAVLAGVPFPVIQALGDWKDINSLQSYIGDSIRKSTALLGILRDKDTKGKKKERTKRGKKTR